MIEVITAGLFTTVQDAGRWGYQAFGMPVSGVMDYFAFRVANILAGNPESAAALEITISGDSFKFRQDAFVAVCGADMAGTLNGVPIENWSSFAVAAGSELCFGYARKGGRAYLAVTGGIDVPTVLGSRSTYTRAAVGGYEGRKLRAGDLLKVGSKALQNPVACVLPEKYRPVYTAGITLRVMPGPQDDLFTAEGLATFFNGSYNIANDSDRMGYRLEGPKITHKTGADIVSDALTQGAVQVAGDGLPIVMMADRQTTGGYTKIGTVISADLMWLAQAKPGDTVAFRQCSEEGAVEALRAQYQSYREIAAWRDRTALSGQSPVHTYKVTVNGYPYSVEISEG